MQWQGGQFAPGLTDPDAAIIGTVRRAHAAVSGRPQAMWGTPYGSDLRLMTNMGGVPTVHYGPGDASLGPAQHTLLGTLHPLSQPTGLTLCR